MARGWTFEHAFLFAVYALAAASYLALMIMEPGQAAELTEEDGPVENTGAALFLVASIVFLAAYLRRKDCEHRFIGIRTKRNVWLLGLAALSFLCFGEEVSWGQRIFSWETPELWQGLNAQHETNIHNLWHFRPYNPDGTPKSKLELMLNANRLFMIFWVFYCIITPVLLMASRPARRLVDRAGIPIPPLAIGCLLLANYVVFRLIEALSGFDSDTFAELKETNYALAYTALAVYFAVYWQAGRALSAPLTSAQASPPAETPRSARLSLTTGAGYSPSPQSQRPGSTTRSKASSPSSPRGV